MNRREQEPISPELVGNKRNLVLGKHSGKRIIKQILDDHDIDADEKLVANITTQIKELGEKNGDVSIEEVMQIVGKKAED